MRPDDSFRIHHSVKMPDGRQVEVVYLSDLPQGCENTANRPPEQIQEAPPMHICFHCGRDLVHPVAMAREDEGCWRLLLRCPECEATREGIFELDEIEGFDRQLDLGTQALLADLAHVSRKNMAEEIELFARALAADLIVPSDF